MNYKEEAEGFKSNCNKRIIECKILVGPSGGSGGVVQHIRNIQKYSKYKPRIFSKTKLSVRCLLDDIAGDLDMFSYTKKESESNMNIYRETSKYIYILEHMIDPYGIFLSKVIFPSRFDLLHLHGSPFWPEIFLQPKNKKIKYVYTIHQTYMKEDFKSIRRWRIREYWEKIKYMAAKQADVVISVSRWQQKLLEEKGVDSIYIPNGVDVEKCQTANPDRFRKKYEIKEDFFLFGGDLRWYKRPELFIELAKKNPDKAFIMKGKRVTRENLIEMGFNPPKNLICLGFLPFQDVLDAVAASRVFVLTSKNDTFPTALLEAMALKKVVVAANNAGPKEIVMHGKDGFLFEPDNFDDLTKKAMMAWENPELGKSGYKKVKEKFDWKVVIKQIDEVYEKLIEGE